MRKTKEEYGGSREEGEDHNKKGILTLAACYLN